MGRAGAERHERLSPQHSSVCPHSPAVVTQLWAPPRCFVRRWCCSERSAVYVAERAGGCPVRILSDDTDAAAATRYCSRGSPLVVTVVGRNDLASPGTVFTRQRRTESRHCRPG